MPSGSRIPFLLDQGNAYGRDDRSVLSAATQVPPAVAVALAWVSAFALFVSVGAQVPPAFVEGPTLVLGSSFTVSAVVEAPVQSTVVGYRLCIRFAVPPVAGLSTPEPAEGEDGNVALMVSNPSVVDKTLAWLASYPQRVP